MKKLFTSVALFLISASVHAQPTVNISHYASGFTGAISDIAHTFDGRLFITEQMGYIRIIQPNGTVSPRPFLDIYAKVTPEEIDSVKEQGLLGLAFSPNFATDGYFYVHYTNKTGVGNIVVARYRVSADPDSADAASEQILLTIYKPYTNHNGGCLKFGADGFLYIAIGDGGGGGDPANRAQNLDSLQGKILRIDVSGGGAYTIPASNPFVSNPNARDEIWAYGLRNPWRFSFDRLNNNLWIGDVGEQIWEEINFQLANSVGGENYGWRCYEGNQAYNTAGCISPSPYISPVYDYSHASTSGCSVTGGYVYRGSVYPSLYGYYFYTDYCNGIIYSLSTDGNFTSAIAGTFSGRNFTTFGENNEGELFVGDNQSGIVYRVVSTPTAIKNSLPDVFQTAVYPSPNSGNFNFEFTLPKTNAVEIRVTDVIGKEIYKLDKIYSEGKNSVWMEMKDAMPGYYFIQLKTDANLICKRFIIQKN